MWALFGNLVGAVVNGLSEGWKRSHEIAKVKLEGKIEVEKAKWGYETAKWQSKAQLAATEEAHVHDYDMQVLLNRAKTILDEFIILSIMAVVALHFIPATQKYMEPGWLALQAAPLWFQLSAVIAVVSTLGGLRVLDWARKSSLGNIFSRNKERSISGPHSVIAHKIEAPKE
jgi:hypothetical protein